MTKPRLQFGVDVPCPDCKLTGRRHYIDPRTGRRVRYREKVGRVWTDFPCPACGGRGYTRRTMIRRDP